MAIYRQIHISFWQDNFVLSLTPEEKFFYLYLMTNSKTSQCGIYELPEKVMTLETGYNNETVNKLLNKFIKYGKIEYNKKNKEIFLMNWAKHNGSNSPTVKTRIENELKGVKTVEFVRKYLAVLLLYGYSIDTQMQEKPEPEEQLKEQSEENPKEGTKIANKKASDFYFESVFNLYVLEFGNLLTLDKWKEWIDYRSEINHKLTKSTAEKQILFLLKQSNPAKCIDDSITNGWQGLFPQKTKEKKYDYQKGDNDGFKVIGSN
ncbi:MAG: replication protein [Ignavibacteriales bacterium]|nr:replication protein [Ignavibacteriales bacterium]